MNKTHYKGKLCIMYYITKKSRFKEQVICNYDL